MLRLTKGSWKRLYSLKLWSPSLIRKRPSKEDASWDIGKGLITLPAGVPLDNAPSPEYWDAFYSCGHYGSPPRPAGDYSSFVGVECRVLIPGSACTLTFLLASYEDAAGLQQPLWTLVLWYTSLRSRWTGGMEDSYIWKPCKIQNVHFYEAMLYNNIFKTPIIPCGILEPAQLSKA